MKARIQPANMTWMAAASKFVRTRTDRVVEYTAAGQNGGIEHQRVQTRG